MVGVADRRGTNAEGLLGIFYVLDYGATGDGQHDDAGGIQAAISAAGSVGGGLVTIPPGVYRLGRAVVWGAAANVTIWQHSGASFAGPGTLPAPAGSNAIRVEPSGATVGGVPTNSLEGDVAAAGATGTAADVGHVHGREAFGGAGVIQAFGDAAAAGAAATPSRSDHRHGMPSSVNQLVNGEFVQNQRNVAAGTWTTGGVFPPSTGLGIDDWRAFTNGTGSFNATLTQDTTVADLPVGASAAVAWTNATANGVANSAGVAQKVEHVTRLRGRALSLEKLVWCNTPNAVRLFVWDGTTFTYSPYHAGDSAWHALTVPNVTPAVGATQLWVGFQIEANCAGRVTDATLVVGANPMDVVPVPPPDDMARCQRYYRKLLTYTFGHYQAAGAPIRGSITYAPMVAAPSVTFANSTLSNCTGLSSAAVNANSAELFATTTALGDAAVVADVILEANV